MCLAPLTLQDGTKIGCRKCWQCRAQKVDDWIGRGIAESEYATATSVVTFTYGRDDDPKSDTYGSEDHLRAKILTYSDLQKCFKSLRRYRRKEKKPGYKFKYLAVGEVGKSKGRAHWHVIFFWVGEVPPHKLREDYFTSEYWPHGYSYWDEGGYESLRYALKYIQKDVGDLERQSLVYMSKTPPLGHEYFQLEAKMYVDEYLAPQDLKYHHPGVFLGDGTVRYFTLRGVSAENFVQSYVDQWREAYGEKPMPYSELVNSWLEFGKLKEPDPTRPKYGERLVPLNAGSTIPRLSEEEMERFRQKRAFVEAKRAKEAIVNAKKSAFVKDLVRQAGSFQDKKLKWDFLKDCWYYQAGGKTYEGRRTEGKWLWHVVDDLNGPSPEAR